MAEQIQDIFTLINNYIWPGHVDLTTPEDDILSHLNERITCATHPSCKVVRKYFAKPPPSYDPALSNATENVNRLLLKPQFRSRFRVFIHGPSGAGKSEFARQLAIKLNKPTVYRHMSNILGKVSLKSIARFECDLKQAQSRGAVLVLDESDDLFKSENDIPGLLIVDAIRKHQGSVICLARTTSLHEFIDLSKFDYKIGMDYLSPEQCRLWFAYLLAQHNESLADITYIEPLIKGMHRLTPKDFVSISTKLSAMATMPKCYDIYAMALKHCNHS